MLMPISDAYVVEYLLQSTRASTRQIVWRERESGGYAASVNGVELELDTMWGRSESLLYVSLSCVAERVLIAEPRNIGVFQDK